jgi:hypothetical protein
MLATEVEAVAWVWTTAPAPVARYALRCSCSSLVGARDPSTSSPSSARTTQTSSGVISR